MPEHFYIIENSYTNSKILFNKPFLHFLFPTQNDCVVCHLHELISTYFTTILPKLISRFTRLHVGTLLY